MLIIEAFLTFGSIGILCAIGALLWRDGRHIRTLRFSLPLVITMICMLLTTGSDALRVGGIIFVVLRMFDFLNGLFIWLLGLSIFDDDFKLGPFEWSLGFAYLVLSFNSRLYLTGFNVFWLPVTSFLVSGVTLIMMCHLIYRALVGRKEDLLEERRRARVFFAVIIAVALISAVVGERISIAFDVKFWDSIWITYLFTFPICLWSILWLMRLQPEAVAFQHKPEPVDTNAMIAPRDVGAHQRLVSIMKHDKGYTEHGLTIGRLAEMVGMPAHQLRGLINRSMGYQNFSAFLNHYRIGAVKHALSDSANARTPVLTLAMDAGFSSLAPFNRAFKAEVGITPTEFRNKFYAKNTPNT